MAACPIASVFKDVPDAVRRRLSSAPGKPIGDVLVPSDINIMAVCTPPSLPLCRSLLDNGHSILHYHSKYVPGLTMLVYANKCIDSLLVIVFVNRILIY
jgi:hypothetical protein